MTDKKLILWAGSLAVLLLVTVLISLMMIRALWPATRYSVTYHFDEEIAVRFDAVSGTGCVLQQGLFARESEKFDFKESLKAVENLSELGKRFAIPSEFCRK